MRNEGKLPLVPQGESSSNSKKLTDMGTKQRLNHVLRKRHSPEVLNYLRTSDSKFAKHFRGDEDAKLF